MHIPRVAEVHIEECETHLFQSPSFSHHQNPWFPSIQEDHERKAPQPPPFYKLSRVLRRKNLCGRYTNCLPTSWTDTGWVNTTGFLTALYAVAMENPLCPMRMFSLVFLRHGVKYPTLDCTPFAGYRLIFGPSEVHRGPCTDHTWDSIVVGL